MNLKPEEILKVKTKGTLNIIEGSPLHKAVISAMKYYAKQEKSKAGTMACNKYKRCLTYEELQNALQKANSLILAYRKKRAHDGLNGRMWDAEKHFEAEQMIEGIEKNA